MQFQKLLLTNPRNIGLSEPRRTSAFVQVRFQLFSTLAFLFDLEQSGPLSSQFCRKSIRQVKGYKLRQTRRIPMG